MEEGGEYVGVGKGRVKGVVSGVRLAKRGQEARDGC